MTPRQAEQSPMLNAALSYARRGWYVLPLHWPASHGQCSCGDPGCESQAKHPRTPHGYKDATRDEEKITDWLKHWPRAGIGIAAGLSGLLILDIDPRNGGEHSWLALRKSLGPDIDHAAIVITGGEGRHLYWRLPDGFDPNSLRSRANAQGPGLDIRCGGGYVVAPPSRHVSGGQYRWDPSGPVDPQEAPESLLAALMGSQNLRIQSSVVEGNPAKPTSTDASPKTSEPDVIPVGGRHEQLKKAGVALRQAGMSGKAVWEALQALNDKGCAQAASPARAGGNCRLGRLQG